MEKIVTSKLGMSLPLITHGSSLLYEVGDDLEEDMVANYAANLEKVCVLLFLEGWGPYCVPLFFFEVLQNQPTCVSGFYLHVK